MSLFALILKNLRQRSLSSVLTALSVALGVALGVALLIVQRQAGGLFGQADFGYDLIVGAKGGRLQLVLNSVYQLDQPPGTVGWPVVESLQDGGEFGDATRFAVPIAVADTLAGRPVIATTPAILGYADDGRTRLPEGERFEYRLGRELELAQGRPFAARRFEAVLGSEIHGATGLGVGDSFAVTHGGPDDRAAHEHAERWAVVGVLRPTGTSLDRVALLPIATSVAVDAHGDALQSVAELLDAGADPADLRDDHADVLAAGGTPREGYVLGPDGTVHPRVPQRLWRVSAVLVGTHGGFQAQRAAWRINNSPDAMAVNPAAEMRLFFDTFLRGIAGLLLLVTALVTVVAAVGILVSIYNSVAARRREVAVLRSLGATRGKVLSIVTLEATLIGTVGAVVGWLAGHAAAAALAEVLRRRTGEGIDPWSVGGAEVAYLLGVVALAAGAGLVPALKAYGTPVAQNLSE